MADLGPLYRGLAPDPDSDYGAVLPWAVNRPGTPAWLQNGSDPRLALPQAVRDGLKGWLDLANATQTGSLTPEAVQALTLGSVGTGLGLAERGALAAGAGRPAIPSLAMDEAARFQRAREMGFHPELNLYHGTARAFDAFAPNPQARSLGQPTAAGVAWSAENPAVANRFAELASQENQGTGSQTYPLVARWNNLAGLTLTGNERQGEMMGTVRDAFLNGYDALRLKNYTTFPEFGPQTIWVFRDPSQLRSRFARFDPAQKDSADLLAARATPGFALPPSPAPGFRGGARAAADMEY